MYKPNKSSAFDRNILIKLVKAVRDISEMSLNKIFYLLLN